MISLYVEEKEEPEKDLADVILEKFKKHHSLWESRKSDSSFIENKTRLTIEAEHKGESIIIPCPACENICLLHYKPDFDYSDRQAWFTGLYATELECFFCDFNVREYDAIDYLRLNDHLINRFGNKDDN